MRHTEKRVTAPGSMQVQKKEEEKKREEKKERVLKSTGFLNIGRYLGEAT